MDNPVVSIATMDRLETIVAVASDLTAALSSEERYSRLLAALKRVIPYDAAALLRLDGEELVPIVSFGLSEDAMGRRFSLVEQPRLKRICGSDAPVVFPADSDLPDPYDGLLAAAHKPFERVHSCLGCPLRIEKTLIGALTADAVTPHAFDGIDMDFLKVVSALAASEMHTTHLIEALEKSAERRGLIARDLMREAELRPGGDLIGTSQVMQNLRREIEIVARSDFTVLITGETGVGKELVARSVHAASGRLGEPMLYVNCAALPETLADSELFGHVRGAFTGASSDRAGKFEVADRGTLFLDEVGELPLSVQSKLLRAIQAGEIQRVGSDKIIHANVRLIAATNRDLDNEVKAGRFRADLFHRLNVYPIKVPALRDRTDDIPLLAGFFCDVTRRRLGIGPVRLAPDALTALKHYSWPGNVRELENVLSRVTLTTSAKVTKGEPVIITKAQLGADIQGEASSEAKLPTALPLPAEGRADFKEVVKEFQRSLIRQALTKQGGNWAAAARLLGMHRSNFHHLAMRLGIKESR